MSSSAIAWLPQSRTVSVFGSQLRYLEVGDGGPALLLLHGVPTNAYLWRNVLPLLAPQARTVALDLIGFGDSDKPVEIRYDLATHAKYIGGAVEALGLAPFVMVATDLGLMAGLQYATANPSKVCGLAMFEGPLLPMDILWRGLPWSLRWRLWLLRHGRARELLVAETDSCVAHALALGTDRTLSRSEVEAYREPLADEAVRRRVWMQGASLLSLNRESTAPGDLVDLVNRNAEALARSPMPKLLLHAKPGLLIRRRAIAAARARLSNLEVRSVGIGRHFLPEDEHVAVGAAIAAFHRRVRDSLPPGRVETPA